MLRLITRERITILEGVPPLFAMLADVPGGGATDLQSLRVVVSSRAPVTRAETSAFHARFGRGVRQVYGSPVTGAISVSSEADVERAPAAIGRPLRGVRVKVVAGGTIAVSSPFAATEYPHDPVATATRFRDGFYLSHDTGEKASDGTITITDRRS